MTPGLFNSAIHQYTFPSLIEICSDRLLLMLVSDSMNTVVHERK